MRDRRSAWRVCLRAAVLAAAIGGSASMANDPPKQTKAKSPRADQPKEARELWLRPDLTPALSMLLVTDSVQDEGVRVGAAAGRIFVTLPFRYDSNAGPATISRSTIRKTGGARFYGLRLLDVAEGAPRLEGGGSSTVYERVSLKPPGSGRLMVSARNSMGPRRKGNGKLQQEALKGESVSVAATGWLAVIFEVPERAEVLTFELAGSGGVEVDVDLLRRVGEGHSHEDLRDPASPVVSAMLRSAQSSSAATACLAIRWLARTRGAWGSGVPAAWLEQVDAVIVAAGGREEVEVRAAGWAYLASYDRLPETTQHHITRQKPEVSRCWAWLVEEHLAGAAEPRREIATQVLAAVLAGEHDRSCEAALDVVDEYAGEIRWELLRGLSSRAQLLVLGRLDSGMENILAMRWIDVLLRDGKPSLAGQIARRARKFSVRIGRPDHPLLLRWRTQESDDQKRALATALAAADMTDVVYSAAFAELFEEATARRTDASLRRAAFELLLRQAERRFGLHGFPAETENGGRGVSGRRTAGLRGCFPLRLGKGASDPLVEGLVRAAREDIDPQRFDALALLLAAGFVDEAEAVIREAKTAEDRNAALKRLMEHGHAADTYGLMAMLGGLIDKEDASSSRLILRYLDETAEKLPPSESWQLLASLRAGVRLDQLCELSFALGPTESPIASRWLCELGHMSRQDRQRLAAPGNAEDRMERLQRIDSRRACLVDGRYGVLVIVEVLVSEEQQHLEDRPIAGDDEGDSEEGADQRPAAKRCYRWQAPRRVTASLPSVLIASSDSDDSFKVMWGDRQIGEGVIVRDPRANRGPAELRPLLVSAGEALLGRGGWGWTVEGPLEQKETFRARLDQALGPALLCAAETGADTPPERRVMVLSVGQYLRSGLREAMGKIETKADPNKWVPQKLQLVLEYGAFGSYHGTGTRSPVPLARSAGKWHLHNVAMVLERID